MLNNRVIPCLLIDDGNLVKTKRFKNARYVGDPINAVKVFNEKEVDEIVILDITATRKSKGPNFDLIAAIAGECFMPLAYGGGITEINQIEALMRLGVEKVVLNSSLYDNPDMVKKAVSLYGSQAVVASVDVGSDMFGRQRILIQGGKQKIKQNAVDYCKYIELLGVGEILLTSIDHEGLGEGYNYDLIKAVASEVGIPVIANGGAGDLNHMFRALVDCGASAVAAGTMFVFFGPHQAVLISYPDYNEIERLMSGVIQ